ncbi:MAG: hypothetical protein AAGA48_37070 [Myxococcota bacterium]
MSELIQHECEVCGARWQSSKGVPVECFACEMRQAQTSPTSAQWNDLDEALSRHDKFEALQVACQAGIRALDVPPVAIQAMWDGDTTGWFIRIEVVTRFPWRSFQVAFIRHGGDLRLFQGAVPPWSEAEEAPRLGSQPADVLEVDFYFPSPHHPDDSRPSWWER